MKKQKNLQHCYIVRVIEEIAKRLYYRDIVNGFVNPVPTVDIVIEVAERIVLIERRNPPFGWALPGGFVDYGESLELAAMREAKEETSLNISLVEQFHSYSDPGRDPRQHTISTVFIARADGTPVAGDDAGRAGLFSPTELPDPVAFDHASIISDYVEYRRTGKRPLNSCGEGKNNE